MEEWSRIPKADFPWKEMPQMKYDYLNISSATEDCSEMAYILHDYIHKSSESKNLPLMTWKIQLFLLHGIFFNIYNSNALQDYCRMSISVLLIHLGKIEILIPPKKQETQLQITWLWTLKET